MSEMEQLSALIGEIYDAALDPSLWSAVLNRTCNYVGGYTANMFIQDESPKSARFVATWGQEPAHWDAYLEKYMKLNPAMPTMLLLETGSVLASNDVVPDARLHATRFYKEWLEPQGFVDCVGTILDKSWTSCAAFVVFRNKEQGRVDERTRRRMALLVPHIRRAVLIGKTIDLQSVANTSFAQTFDALATGIYLLNASGVILHVNLSGAALRARGDILCASGDRLRAVDLDADTALREMFVAASAHHGPVGPKGNVVALAAADRERFVAHILPLTSGARGRDPHYRGAAFAVFVHQATLERPTLVEAVAQRYRLTPAELRVLFAIIEVGGAPEVAAVLGVSKGTVKTHLKSLFAKTGTFRQADLARIVAEFANSPLF